MGWKTRDLVMVLLIAEIPMLIAAVRQHWFAAGTNFFIGFLAATAFFFAFAYLVYVAVALWCFAMVLAFWKYDISLPPIETNDRDRWNRDRCQ